jgi:hypothetical protein
MFLTMYFIEIQNYFSFPIQILFNHLGKDSLEKLILNIESYWYFLMFQTGYI